MSDLKKQKRYVYRTAGSGLLAMALLSAASCLVIWSGRRTPVTPVKTESDQTTAAISYHPTAGMNILIGDAPTIGTQKEAVPPSLEEQLGTAEGDSFYLDSAMGSMMYYSQKDARWKDYLWGGEDPMRVYGCGPTVMAMLANAFGNQGRVTPVTMAEWCDANGQRGSGAGSNHSIVNASLTAYGLSVESLNDKLNTEYVSAMLRSGHILVALVGRGYFTDGGHFILIRGINEDGTVNIADPASAEHTNTPYPLEFILGELKLSASDEGGPLWCVSKP